MTTQLPTVQIPLSLYRRLERMAALTRHSVEEVVTQALISSVPPLPENLPENMRADLLALEKLSDEALWEVARSVVSQKQHEQHSELLEKNRSGTITEAERAKLTQLRQEADELMLRKAYTYVLLKWRGYRLPALAELEEPA